jgi:transcriptional regulator with XRE-family HTH domain
MSNPPFQTMMGLLHDLLKARGLRHEDIAARLNVTVRSVTRWFTADGLDTRILDQLCELVEISFFELCRLAAKRAEPRIAQLTEEQEQVLADEPLESYLFTRALGGWTAQEMAREVAMPEAMLIDGLLRLQKLGLIDLLPGNEIRLRTENDVEWRPNGPMARYTNRWLNWALSDVDVGEPDSLWAVDGLKLSTASLAQLRQEFRKLLVKARELSDADRRTHARDRAWHVLVMATRPLSIPPIAEWQPLGRAPRRLRAPVAVAAE